MNRTAVLSLVALLLLVACDNERERSLMGPSAASVASNLGLNLDQCQNIDLNHLADPCGTTPGVHPDWANGDVQAVNSQYREGDGLPYRNAVGFTSGLSNGTWVVRVDYDFTQGGKFAIDRLTRFDLTQASNPCLSTTQVSCTLSGGFFEFDMPGEVASPSATQPALPNSGALDVAGTAATLAAADKRMRVWVDGGSGTFVSAGQNATLDDGFVKQNGDASSNSDREFAFKFTLSGCPAGGCKLMMGWSGHIASALDWGANKGAGSISGAAFHMRIEGVDQADGTQGGNQDRSFKTSAVVQTITVTKALVPSSDGGLFNLQIDGVTKAPNVGDGGTTGQIVVASGSRSVGETAGTSTSLSNYTSSISCVDGLGNAVASGSGASISVSVAAGANIVCTITNSRVEVAPSVVTEIHNADHTAVTSVGAGTTVHDKATVSGSLGTPTGTVTFTFFTASKECTGASVGAGTVTLVGGVAHPSDAGALPAGGYSFKAHYNGEDPNYLSADSPCEPLTVNPLQPLLTTTASQPSTVPGAIYDVAHLSGGFGTPGGTISFTLYSDATCSSTAVVFTDSKPVSGNGDYTSASFTVNAGSYHWVASYSGDANNAAAGPTACSDAAEAVTIRQAQALLGTLPTPASGTVGVTLNDGATLTGASPTGSIVFKLFDPDQSSCTGTPRFTQTVSVSGNATYNTTGGFVTDKAGTWRWTANYSGDVNNSAATSGCNDEPVTVGKATPTLTTTASGPVAVGQDIHDVAHLSGGFAPLGGTISFSVFAPGDATCGTPLTPAPTGATVSGAGNYTSGNFTTSAAGTYRWIASYSGDANNAAVSTSCNDAGEASTVEKATPALTTTASQPSTVPGAIYDVAHLSGGFGTPGGTISFTLYSDATCSSTAVVFTDSKPVSGNGDYTSASFTVNAGSYHWVAAYSGDANNKPAGPTACSDAAEAVTIRQAQALLGTSPTPPSGTVGVTLNDGATLSGGASPTGSIVFKLFDPDQSTCTGTPRFTQTVSVSGNANYTTTGGFVADKAGTWRWTADYSGDVNNSAATSGCNDEPVTITSAVARLTPGYWKNHPTQTTALLPYTLGNYSVGDFATVTAVFNAMNCGLANNQSQSAVGCLAGHLLAAKLNVKNGADGCIGPTIAAADAFLISVGYSGPTPYYTLTAAQRSTAIGLKTTLDQYNNNISCP